MKIIFFLFMSIFVFGNCQSRTIDPSSTNTSVTPQVSGNGRIRISYEKVQGLEDYKKWNGVIKAVFEKYQKQSHFSYEVKIYFNPNFNAGVFNNHSEGNPMQTLIFTGALDALDKQIEKSNLIKSEYCKTGEECREFLLSPIIAHELAHYFQNDNSKIKSILKNANLSLEEQSDKIRNLELQADLYAKELMIRAGLGKDASHMILSLEIIKDHIKKGKSKIDDPKERPDYYGYESFHPSLNERLINLGGYKYQLPYQLDKNFSIIRNSLNTNALALACSAIEEAKFRFPENTELKRELAVCYHKLWISTAGEKCLQFIPLIDAPSFSDDIEFIAKKAESCGDPEYYNKAIQKYEELKSILESDDKFLSNYEIILLYSEKVTGKKILSKTKKSFFQKLETRIPSLLDKDSLNNYGIIQYFRGNKTTSKLIFQKLGGTASDATNKFCAFKMNLLLFQLYEKDKANIDPKAWEDIAECKSSWKEYLVREINR